MVAESTSATQSMADEANELTRLIGQFKTDAAQYGSESAAKTDLEALDVSRHPKLAVGQSESWASF